MTVLVGLLVLTAVVLWPSRRRARLGPGANRALLGRSAVPAWVLRGRNGRGPPVGEVADTLVLLALAVRSGAGLTQALAEVAAISGPQVRADLGAVVAALRWGRPAHEAWGYAGVQWRPAALAWQVAESTGAAPSSIVERAASGLREQQALETERRAARAGVLLVLPLGLGFLPAFACTAVVPVVVALASGQLDGGG